MLLTFTFKNFGPFREENVFDMRAVKSYKEHENHCVELFDNERVLKVAAVFGANASGKSSFVEAYRYFSSIVRESFRRGSDEDSNDNDNEPLAAQTTALSKYYNPFRFSPDDEDTVTEFDALFSADDGEYRYGFSYDARHVVSEWLYFYRDGGSRATVILERLASDDEPIRFGATVRKQAAKYSEEIPADVLVLSFFIGVSLKNDVFKEAAKCIYSVLPLPPIGCAQISDDLIGSLFADGFDDKREKRLLDFLHSIDIGIKGFTVRKNGDDIRVFTHHSGTDGNDYEAPIEIESDGTRKLIGMYWYINAALTGDRTLVLDEFDSELHPLLVHYIVNLFHTSETKGQMIFTTHDSTLLDRRYLRRDQIWFCDKDDKGQANIYPLSKFSVRNDASFATSYFSGAYDGVPKLKHALWGAE